MRCFSLQGFIAAAAAAAGRTSSSTSLFGAADQDHQVNAGVPHSSLSDRNLSIVTTASAFGTVLQAVLSCSRHGISKQYKTLRNYDPQSLLFIHKAAEVAVQITNDRLKHIRITIMGL